MGIAVVGIRAAIGLGLAAAALFGSGSAASAADVQRLVDRVIAAHGGMEAWVGLQDVSFTLTLVRLAPDGDVAGARVSLYRLKRHGKARVESVTGDGLLVEGFDGQRAWVTLAGTRLTEPDRVTRAHFEAVNWWYWLGIPFKWRDPGTLVRERPTGRFHGKPALVLEVTFAPAGPTDRFTYYVDPASYHILGVETDLKPGAWPGVGGRGPSWSTWHDYRPVGPFVMHTGRVFYGNRDLTERRGVLRFGDFRVNAGLPDRLFQAP